MAGKEHLDWLSEKLYIASVLKDTKKTASVFSMKKKHNKPRAFFCNIHYHTALFAWNRTMAQIQVYNAIDRVKVKGLLVGRAPRRNQKTL